MASKRTDYKFPNMSKQNPTSYESYAPRTMQQRERLARVAELTAGPETTALTVTKQANASDNLCNALQAYSLIEASRKNIENQFYHEEISEMAANIKPGQIEFSGCADELFDDYDGFQFCLTVLSKSQNQVVPINLHYESEQERRESIHQAKLLTIDTIAKLKIIIHTLIKLRSTFNTILASAESLQIKHGDLLKHSGELAQQCERLQQEEQILSAHANEIGLPLKHYDTIDNLAVKVGVLFKERNGQSLTVRGLARVNVDSEEYLQVLDGIDEAMEFFVLGQGRTGAQGAEYGKRSSALHEAALDLIKVRIHMSSSIPSDFASDVSPTTLFIYQEAVVERITQTTRDIQTALGLSKGGIIPADKLEASLVYTRFYGISSRSNTLIMILQLRHRRRIAPLTYAPLLLQCQAVYCSSRHLLLYHSVKKHIEKLKEDHGLVGMTRLACLFLMRICSVEYSLYLAFFGIPSNVLDPNNLKARHQNHEHVTEGYCPAELSSELRDFSGDNRLSSSTSYVSDGHSSSRHIKNTPSPFLDDEPLQKMLTNTICSTLHRIVRRGVVLLSDMDVLCQVVSVLREERAAANTSSTTRALARSISAMIEDAQERLIFCTQAVLTKEVMKFRPSPSDVDYPNRLLTLGTNNDSFRANSSQTTVEEKYEINWTQMQCYSSWYPPTRSVLKVLSKIFKVVEPRVFEDIALQAVQACTRSLKDAANSVRVLSSVIDSDLFLVKHLLILREQLSPFDIQLRAVERQLDFSEAGKAVTKFLATRNRRIFSMSTENALVTLLREGVSIQESAVDSKRDLEDALRNACNDFIEHSSIKVASPLFDFVDQCKSALSSPNSSLQIQTFMASLAVINTLEALKIILIAETSSLKHLMNLYLDSNITQGILLRPVMRKISRALEDAKKFISSVQDNWTETEAKALIFQLLGEIEGLVRTHLNVRPVKT